MFSPALEEGCGAVLVLSNPIPSTQFLNLLKKINLCCLTEFSKLLFFCGQVECASPVFWYPFCSTGRSRSFIPERPPIGFKISRAVGCKSLTAATVSSVNVEVGIMMVFLFLYLLSLQAVGSYFLRYGLP